MTELNIITGSNLFFDSAKKKVDTTSIVPRFQGQLITYYLYKLTSIVEGKVGPRVKIVRKTESEVKISLIEIYNVGNSGP